PFAVRGKRDPIVASVLGAARSRPERTEAAAHLFVGRAAELEGLTEAWRRAADGDGDAVEIVGDAGLGKSTLINALIDAVEAPAVWRSGGDLSVSMTAFAAVRPLVRAVGGIDDDVDSGAAGDFLTKALADDRELLAWAPMIASVIGASVAPSDAVDAI